MAEWCSGTPGRSPLSRAHTYSQSSANAQARNNRRARPGGLALLLLCFRRGFSHGRLGHERLSLCDPVVLLDTAPELQGFVQIGDVIVRERSNLIVAQHVELLEPALEILGDAGYALQIVRLPLGLLEAFESG